MRRPAPLPVLLPCVLLLFHLSLPAAPRADDAAQAIERRLVEWTDDFNAGRLDVVCDLFAPDLRSNYGGHPENSFETLCNGLQEALSDDARSFRYELDLDEIIVSGDMAVVRLVWRLTVTEKATGNTVTSADRGLDVFRLQPDGKWRISRFIAYELEDG